MSGVLIEGCAIATVDAAGTEHAEGWILIDGTRIAALGGGRAAGGGGGGAARRRARAAWPRRASSTATTTSTSGRPAGSRPEEDLFGWLTTLYPVWARIDEEIVHASAAAALAALAVSGCSTSHRPPLPVPGRR